WLNFDEFKGFAQCLCFHPLKIPHGALLLDPTTSPKVDKTFNCHRQFSDKDFQTLFRVIPNEVSHKSFCQTFFKKFVGLRGKAPHGILKGNAL
ncbi:MAG: hypothetical protein IJU14_06360, partial [Clostridia bacterium]|nr:hypothetical protein [Clostridia bacterium]